jgi:protein TonB
LKETEVGAEPDNVVPPPDAPSATIASNKVFNENELEQPPVFPGGKSGVDSYIAENLKYPTIAKENNIQGMVVVAFEVDELGRVVHPKLLRDISNGCGQAALQVVKTMPNWSAGKYQGKPVKTRIVLPVKFSLE